MIQTEQKYALTIKLINPTGSELDINADSVISFNITENVLTLLPRFDMVITDKGSFIEGFPFTDKMYFYISLSHILDEDPVIDGNFRISSFAVASDSHENQVQTFKVTGYLDADNMFKQYIRTCYTGSSDSVIGNVVESCGLTFDNRTTGVENNKWYQNGNNYQFLTHVADRSFVDGDGVFVYGDTNSNIVYTSFNTEASKEAKYTAKYSKQDVERSVRFEDDEDVLFYDSYNIINNSDMYNNYVVYGGQYSYYDLEKYVYTDIKLDSKMTDFYNFNEKFKNEYGVFSKSVGLLPDEKIFDTIYKGLIQNAFYKYSMWTINIWMNVNALTNVELFDKIDVDLPSTVLRDAVNDTYSGEYLVGSVTYNITRNAPVQKSVILCRYGMNDMPDTTLIKDII